MITKKFIRERVTIDPETGCWNWNGRGTGYGRIKGTGAHRASWMVHRGPIPDGLWVLHRIRCSNKRCVRPSHLYLGTASDNARDMFLTAAGDRVREAARIRAQRRWTTMTTEQRFEHEQKTVANWWKRKAQQVETAIERRARLRRKRRAMQLSQRMRADDRRMRANLARAQRRKQAGSVV